MKWSYNPEAWPGTILGILGTTIFWIATDWRMAMACFVGSILGNVRYRGR